MAARLPNRFINAADWSPALLEAKRRRRAAINQQTVRLPRGYTLTPFQQIAKLRFKRKAAARILGNLIIEARKRAGN